WQEACPAAGDGHIFTLVDSEDTSSEMTTTGGVASWTGVPPGQFTLSETLEPGWGEPIVWCGWTAYVDGAVLDAFPQQVSTTSGAFSGEIPYPGTTYVCFWFNIPVDYSSITVIKLICPEGPLEGVVPNPLNAYLDMCTTKGNGIEFVLENSLGQSSATTLDGIASWSDVPSGPFTLTETLPPGYSDPVWFCAEIGGSLTATAEGYSAFVAGDVTLSSEILATGTRYVCWVFNFPDPDRTIEVFKWLCPEGYTGESYEDWSSACTLPLDGVKFTVTDEGGNWPIHTSGGGHAAWYGVSQGTVSLDEQIPPGYFEPIIYCSLEAQNGEAIAEGLTYYPSTNGAISRDLNYSEYHWVCHVYNVPKGPGEITIYKWLCPPGYDFYGWGADPKKDCTQRWNGVHFTLDQPVGPNQQSMTGDSIDGAVYFGDLEPGKYVVSETVPADIDYIFVLDCTGSDVDKVHPYPLQWGNHLTVDLAGGDSIVCNWYNVPRPENGWVTVYKYQCWTPKFTSAVDCEIYEHGASFELWGWPGNTSHGVGTTNVGGLYTWADLPEGAYDLDESSHIPCKVTTTKTDGKGHIWVDAGQGTIVKVYNCKPKTPPPPGTPTVPGKPPGKYPNTGVGPSGAVHVAPAQATHEGTPTPSVEDYYLISCLDVTPEATPSDETASESEDGTPTPTPEVEEFDLPLEIVAEEIATPADGTPAPEEECIRGAIPDRVVVDAAQVDAGVEILEIIDGVMEQPTGPELVTWYKETGRLGENNNVVIAGHLNYWGVPQGVFFYLDQLRPGDKVEITGDDGKTYVFEIEWVRQESNLAPPDAEVIGPTDAPSLTLITCGGEWNASISEYDERTVARAVQVEVRPADDA
ncbi:MAG: sortase, partial [Thermomicrobiales bacterium]